MPIYTVKELIKELDQSTKDCNTYQDCVTQILINSIKLCEDCNYPIKYVKED